MGLLRRVLSPFPEGAERPWRGVWVYLSHSVEEHLRSWAFWLALVGVPAIYLLLIPLIAVVSVLGDEPVQWWAESPAVADAIRAESGSSRDMAWVQARPEAVGPAGRAVLLEGASLETVQVTVRAGDEAPDVDELVGEVRRWMHQARVRAALDPEELRVLRPDLVAPEEEVLERAETVSEVAGGVQALIGAVVIGLVAFFGASSGAGAAMDVARLRDEEYFHVLRLASPVSVIFVGGLVERSAIGALSLFPVLLFAGPALVVVGVAGAFADPDRATLYLLALPGLVGCTAVASWLVAAGVGAVVGSLTRNPGQPQPGAARAMYPLALFLGFPVGVWLLELPVDGVHWAMFLPVVGLVLLAKGVGTGLAAGWVAVVGPLNVLLGLAALRVGAWTYGQEEEPWVVVRRRLGFR